MDSILIWFFCILITSATVFVIVYKLRTAVPSPGEKKKKEKDKISIKDSISLIDEIDDLKDGIIICNNATRFVTGITCRGVNLFEYDENTQRRIMNAFQGFINTIDSPITYRLYSRSLDISVTRKKYEDQIRSYKLDMSAAEEAMEQLKGDIMHKDEYAAYEKVYETLKFKLIHLAVQLRAMNIHSDGNVVQDVSQVYLFDFTFSPGNYVGKKKAKDRFEIAKKELSIIAESKINALLSCGVKARPCTQADMIDMFRRTTQPYSADSYTTHDIDSSSYYSDVQGSTSSDIIFGDKQAAYTESPIDRMANIRYDKEHGLVYGSLTKTELEWFLSIPDGSDYLNDFYPDDYKAYMKEKSRKEEVTRQESDFLSGLWNLPEIKELIGNV